MLRPQLTVVAEEPEVVAQAPTVDETQDVIIVEEGLTAPPAQIAEEIELAIRAQQVATGTPLIVEVDDESAEVEEVLED